MTRKAIIIGNNTGKDAPKNLPGVDKDMENYLQYLTSGGGGNWYRFSEITTVHNGKRADILSAIKSCSADYTFVVFTGHGFINSNDNLTYVCVADGFICEDELRTGSSRQSLILDCCREKHTVTETRAFGLTEVKALRKSLENDFGGKSSRVGGTNIEMKLLEDFKERVIQNPRIKFDEALGISSHGLFIGYACEIDQTSGDNPLSGGVFSTALMRTGKEFSKKNDSDWWCTIKKAVSTTSSYLRSDPFTTQRPDYQTSPATMSITAPFAITNKPNE